MLLQRFSAKAINGYLDIDIYLRRDLTFITGINGSGKTTALNSIVALLIPRVDYLASHEFKSMSLEFMDGDKAVVLSALRDKYRTILTCSRVDDEFIVEPPATDPDVPPHRAAEYEADYYRELQARDQSNAVLSYISELPSPMYLGLNRRMVSPADQSARAVRPGLARYSRPHKRNIFGASLTQSLSEALSYSERRYRIAMLEKSRLDEFFQRDTILSLLDLPPISVEQSFDHPSPPDIRRLKQAKENIYRLPELLKIPSNEILDRLNPLFDFLEKKATELQVAPRKRAKGVKKSSRDSDASFNALIDWSFNKSHLDKINQISSRIGDYNDDVAKLFSNITEFIESINSFVADSGKVIDFDSQGRLVFKVEGDADGIEHDMTTLSSGEVQILVILAHLYFNPEARGAGVFIVDEPELSLHVQWQEKFVDRIREAAPEIQLVMATHSPSIIQDKVEFCVDMPRK